VAQALESVAEALRADEAGIALKYAEEEQNLFDRLVEMVARRLKARKE
jgi:hypothetical protein